MGKCTLNEIREYGQSMPRLHLGQYQGAVELRIDQMEEEHFALSFWRKDYHIYKNDQKIRSNVENSMGWLHVVEKMQESLPEIETFVSEIRNAGFQDVVLLGMGGSSLAPLVFDKIFNTGEKQMRLFVVDSTDPGTILSTESQINLQKTLFIVASKSGGTAEVNAFFDYFYAKVSSIDPETPGSQFIAITDPNTALQKVAKEKGLRRTFLNFADVGGRYSALTYFGLIPAALVGVNISELLCRALRMVHACSPG